jgi:dihydroorotate dehydrogenase
MTSAFFALARPFLFRIDPETAHRLTLFALAHLSLLETQADDTQLTVNAFGLDFSNPVGLAAGFDKNAEAAGTFAPIGFGFAEIGTITPRPQPGNPRPRIFRLPRDGAVINRLGFPSGGHLAVHARLALIRRQGLIGINLGANKESQDRTADYARGIEAFADLADYFTINISSPNTPGLRDLQRAEALDDLLARVLDTRDHMARSFPRRPVLLKIAPDLSLAELDAIIACARKRRIDGLIISNTTVSRPSSLRDDAARETGGLSGQPLFALSTRMLASAFLRVDGQFPLIGAGGIDSADAAWAKLEAGASLIQLYTGLIFKGPALIGDIKRGLLRQMAQKGFARITDITGTAAKDWVSREPPPEGLVRG